jgi:hypothetical protein
VPKPQSLFHSVLPVKTDELLKVNGNRETMETNVTVKKLAGSLQELPLLEEFTYKMK